MASQRTAKCLRAAEAFTGLRPDCSVPPGPGAEIYAQPRLPKIDMPPEWKSEPPRGCAGRVREVERTCYEANVSGGLRCNFILVQGRLESWANSAQRTHLSAMRFQTSLFSRSREHLAMNLHSAACRMNTSEGVIGRSPCSESRT
jgi:hypothetical protein